MKKMINRDFGGPRLRVTRRRVLIFITLFALLSLNACPMVMAEDKSWNAGGDQSDWFDDANWLPAGKPTASDDVKIDMLSASSTLSQAFDIKSLTLGGKKASTLTVSNFVPGNVKPASVSNIAVLNRKNGHLILKGSAGKITLNGMYKDSEEVISEEPSFMLYVQ